MAHTKSSIKDLKRTKKRTTRNRTLKSKMRTLVKKARVSVEAGNDDAVGKMNSAIVVLDKMVSKGIVHPNNAARKKSRLIERQTKLAKGISTAQPPAKKSAEEKPVIDADTIAEKPEQSGSAET